MWPMLIAAGIQAAGSIASSAVSSSKGSADGSTDASSQAMNGNSYSQSNLGDQEAANANLYQPTQELQNAESYALLPDQYALQLKQIDNAYQQASQVPDWQKTSKDILDQVKTWNDQQNTAAQQGFDFANNAYGQAEHSMDLARPVNDQTQLNKLQGLKGLQSLQTNADNYDVQADANRAYADSVQQGNGQDQQLERTMAGYGISPGSNAYISALATNAANRAATQAQAYTQGWNTGNNTKFTRQQSTAQANTNTAFDDTALKAVSVAPKATGVSTGGGLASAPQNTSPVPFSYYDNAQTNGYYGLANSSYSGSSTGDNSSGSLQQNQQKIDSSGNGASTFSGQMAGNAYGTATKGLSTYLGDYLGSKGDSTPAATPNLDAWRATQ